MIQYAINHSTQHDVEQHLLTCDESFPNRLSSRVDIPSYASKLAEKAIRFEAWDDEALVGLIACYNNTENRSVYITSVSTLENYHGKGIAQELLNQVIQHTNTLQYKKIELEVHAVNYKAIALYTKNGFEETNIAGDEEMKKLTYFTIRE